MVKAKVIVKNPTGFHLRPAGKICEQAVKFKSLITFQKGNKIANAKSLLSILGSCIKSGDEVEFTCEGPDEEEALAAVIALIENGLDE